MYNMNENNPYNIIIEPRNFSIADFIDENKQHKYVVQPIFQRLFVWDNEKSSKLIETIILNFPIPTIYSFLHHVDGKFHIIDGQQRLTAIRKFITNGFPLTGLKLLPHLNGTRFDQLNERLQQRILDYVLDSKCLHNVSDKKVIYEIFERFNTGIDVLKPQEIRNCVFAGQFNSFIKDNLAAYKPFSDSLAKDKVKRMFNVELATRFLAMYETNSFQQYSIQSFINSYYVSKQHLDSLNRIEFTEKTRELERIFKKAVDACKIVFGSNAFKNYILNPKTKDYRFNQFAPKVYDLQMLCFAELDLALVKRYSNKIFKEYINFAKNNPYLNSNLEGKQNLKNALKKWLDQVGKIIYE